MPNLEPVASVFVSVALMGKASTHLLKMSVTTRMYFIPLELAGNGPIISQVFFSNGWLALIVPRGACGTG